MQMLALIYGWIIQREYKSARIIVMMGARLTTRDDIREFHFLVWRRDDFLKELVHCETFSRFIVKRQKVIRRIKRQTAWRQ